MLEVRNLYKSFDVAGKRQRVIEDLSFVVQDRDFYMILGQSGCGKSTLLRMLGGFAAPDVIFHIEYKLRQPRTLITP